MTQTLERWKIWSLLRLATMNTSDTTERPCVEETSGSDRLWASSRFQHFVLDSPRTYQDENHVLKKEGKWIHTVIRLQGMQIKERTEAMLQEGSSQRIQSRVNLHPGGWSRQIQLDDKEGSQESNECTTSEENKVQESIQMNGDTPVAFRTRRCRQQTDSTKLMVMKKILDKIQIETKTKNWFNDWMQRSRNNRTWQMNRVQLWRNSLRS